MKRLYAVYQGPAGYTFDKKKFMELEKSGNLEQGELYVVKQVFMGPSRTLIELEGLNKILLNCVSFEFYYMNNNKLEEHDIFEDEEFNPYLTNNSNSL